VTLLIYLVGVLATSWSFWSFAIFRVISGVGIGGEYAAINSAIDELIPARYRGRVHR
jgi:MFS family permease